MADGSLCKHRFEIYPDHIAQAVSINSRNDDRWFHDARLIRMYGVGISNPDRKANNAYATL
jgi:hypothetical protein